MQEKKLQKKIPFILQKDIKRRKNLKARQLGKGWPCPALGCCREPAPLLSLLLLLPLAALRRVRTGSRRLFLSRQGRPGAGGSRPPGRGGGGGWRMEGGAERGMRFGSGRAAACRPPTALQRGQRRRRWDRGAFVLQGGVVEGTSAQCVFNGGGGCAWWGCTSQKRA